MVESSQKSHVMLTSSSEEDEQEDTSVDTFNEKQVSEEPVKQYSSESIKDKLNQMKNGAVRRP